MEGEKDQRNEPSKSKAGQTENEDEENINDEFSLEPQTTGKKLELVDTRPDPPEPQSQQHKSAQKSKKQTPAPQSKKQTNGPQSKKQTPVPQSQQQTLAPQSQHNTTDPISQQHTPALQSQQHTPAPQSQQHTPDTQSQQHTPTPQSQQHPPGLQSQQHPLGLQTQQQTPAPQSQQQTPDPQSQKHTPAPVYIKSDVQPVLSNSKDDKKGETNNTVTTSTSQNAQLSGESNAETEDDAQAPKLIDPQNVGRMSFEVVETQAEDETPASTHFFGSEVHPAVPGSKVATKDETNDKAFTLPPENEKQPGKSDEAQDEVEHQTTDPMGQGVPSGSTPLEHRIDSQNVGKRQKQSAVETSLADIFFEITGADCDGLNCVDNCTDGSDEITTSCQRNSYYSNIPLFSGFLDLFENETESEGSRKNGAEDEEGANIESNTLPQQVCPATEDVLKNIPPSQPGPSTAKLPKANKSNNEEEMYEFLNAIYNPSPYIQKQKIEHEKEKLNMYNEKVAMKIMEKMIQSSMNNSTTKLSPSLYSGPPLAPDQLDHLMQRVNELEKRLKRIEREKRESERAKKNLLEHISELEQLALDLKKKKVVKKIVKAEEPTEKDIENLTLLKNLLIYEYRSTKELKELERQNRIMERVLSQAESGLTSAPWFRSDDPAPPSPKQRSPQPAPDPASIQPPANRKIRFQELGVVVYFDNKEAPIKVPHWNSNLVETITINAGDNEKEEIDEDDEDLIEVRMQELRKKKQEEKLVKVSIVDDEQTNEEIISTEGSSSGELKDP